METPNTWEARNRAREASNDYYQKGGAAPLNGYDAGEVDGHPSDYTEDEKVAAQDSSTARDWKGDVGTPTWNDSGVDDSTDPIGIKKEDSMDGSLADENPGYKKEAGE